MDSIDLARRARKSSLEMVHNAGASHIGSALSMIDIVAVLYSDIMNIFPNDPSNKDRDRLILSKGHACVGIYSVLGNLDFFPSEMLLEYGKNESILMNHISHKVPGVEFSTGSLGHGLSFGVGKALAAKKMKSSWKTFVILSDGELQEGSNWEAFMFSAFHNLSNLVAVIDFNNLQSLTTVDKTLGVQPLDKKLESFGWNVLTVNGHDHEELRQSLKKACNEKLRPTVIIANTIKGKGVSFMENKVEWHYRTPSKDELIQAIAEIESA